MTQMKPETDIAYWLELLDALPLECDGLTRITSALLHRENVEHSVCVGSLDIEGRPLIPMHLWIELQDGRIVDLRARMWAGKEDDVPHGIFTPAPNQRYVAEGHLDTRSEHPIIFAVLAERPIESFPLGLADAVASPEAQPAQRPRPK